MFKLLAYIGTLFSGFSLVYIPALIEQGHFLASLSLTIGAVLIGLVSVMYLDDPNNFE